MSKWCISYIFVTSIYCDKWKFRENLVHMEGNKHRYLQWMVFQLWKNHVIRIIGWLWLGIYSEIKSKLQRKKMQMNLISNWTFYWNWYQHQHQHVEKQLSIFYDLQTIFEHCGKKLSIWKSNNRNRFCRVHTKSCQRPLNHSNYINHIEHRMCALSWLLCIWARSRLIHRQIYTRFSFTLLWTDRFSFSKWTL